MSNESSSNLWPSLRRDLEDLQRRLETADAGILSELTEQLRRIKAALLSVQGETSPLPDSYVASFNMFNSFNQLSIKVLMESHSCPECGSAEHVVASKSALQCRSCGISRCKHCKNMWNVDHRCATSVALSSSWDNFKDLAVYEMQLKPMGFKRCPSCQLACEKQAHDNSYHHKRCQFYEPCNEPPKLEKNCPVCQATGVPCLRPPQAHAARRAEINQRALGLEVKHLREFLEQSDGALVTERTEAVQRPENPFNLEALSQMFCGGPLASCCRVLNSDPPAVRR
ncbi:unnamed protein product [Symbiodinium natans]|uniref:Uncharacterized protein n=1 Tax=Symbiodinium natans TaxID=878477 RepID=A0A812VCB8_9DINO|nr:unnamed protein product [Symbiodinium natans]